MDDARNRIVLYLLGKFAEGTDDDDVIFLPGLIVGKSKTSACYS